MNSTIEINVGIVVSIAYPYLPLIQFDRRFISHVHLANANFRRLQAETVQ